MDISGGVKLARANNSVRSTLVRQNESTSGDRLYRGLRENAQVA